MSILVYLRLKKLVFRPPLTSGEVVFERVENKLRVVLFAAIPDAIAYSSQLAGRERSIDLLYDVMVEIGPGIRKDRESVYNDLINKANVELKGLHDNLYKWNFTRAVDEV